MINIQSFKNPKLNASTNIWRHFHSKNRYSAYYQMDTKNGVSNMTGAWFIPIGFWVVGMVFMIGGAYVGHKMSETKHQLHEKAKSTQFKDKSASLYFGMEKEMMDMMPWVPMRLLMIIAGMVIFAFGFVAMSFVI